MAWLADNPPEFGMLFFGGGTLDLFNSSGVLTCNGVLTCSEIIPCGV